MISNEMKQLEHISTDGELLLTGNVTKYVTSLSSKTSNTTNLVSVNPTMTTCGGIQIQTTGRRSCTEGDGRWCAEAGIFSVDIPDALNAKMST